MGLTTNQIIIGCAVLVVVVGGIIAAIVLSRPKDQTDPDYTTKPTTKPTTKAITKANPITKSTSTPIVNTNPEIKIRTIRRDITLPVFQECWSSAIKGEYCTNITLPSNIKATPFRSPMGSTDNPELLIDIYNAAKINMLVTCNLDNNTLLVINEKDVFKKPSDSDSDKNMSPAGILLGLKEEEIEAGTTRSFSIEEKITGFKFSKV